MGVDPRIKAACGEMKTGISPFSGFEPPVEWQAHCRRQGMTGDDIAACRPALRLGAARAVLKKAHPALPTGEAEECAPGG